MNKLIGIIGFDMLVILTPLLIGVAPELVNGVSYFLVGISILSILMLLFSVEGEDGLKKIELERRNKPCWWNKYDVFSDSVFAFMWVAHGFYVVVFLLVMVKIFTLIKIPNYYKGV